MGKKRLKRVNRKWNSNLAYAVGLIATDGYISKDGRHITLTSSDYQQIETFRNCLDKSNKITIDTPSSISKKTSYGIQIGDVVLLEWLKSIGISNNKSLTIGELKIPDKYYPDFIRGSLDGDGHIRSYIDQYNSNKNPSYIYKRFFIFFNSASSKHLVWIRHKLFKLLSLRGSFQIANSKTQIGKNSMYAIKYSTKEAIKLANWIYYNSKVPCLKRKRSLAEEYISHKR